MKQDNHQDQASISAVDRLFGQHRSAVAAGQALRRYPDHYAHLIFQRRFGRAIASGDTHEVAFLAWAFRHWRSAGFALVPTGENACPGQSGTKT